MLMATRSLRLLANPRKVTLSPVKGNQTVPSCWKALRM